MISDLLRLPPGDVDLSSIATDAKPGFDGEKADGEKALPALGKELADLQEKLHLTYIFIAHDLSVVRQVSTRIAVMYLGSIVEEGPAEEVFAAPAHPYSQALISAVPVVETTRKRVILTGDVPSPLKPRSGCRFHPRCPIAVERCRNERQLREYRPGRKVACHFPTV